MLPITLEPQEHQHMRVTTTIEFVASARNTAALPKDSPYPKVNFKTSEEDITITEGDNEWWIDTGANRPILTVRFEYNLSGQLISGEEAHKADSVR